MKQFYLLAGAIFMASLTSYAQNIRVLDSAKNTPVAGATVVALNQATGKIEKQGTADADGAFISVDPGTGVLYLSVTAMGYKKTVVKQAQGNQTILLAPDSKQLKEVKITTNKSPVKFNGNIMEYDISQVANAEYLSLPEIIDHLPFLQVTTDGKIKMTDEVLTILIDNRPSIIYTDGPSLRSIPPQAIEKVEVTLIPTARNGDKTINITLKHDYFLGWNGSAGVGGSRLYFGPSAAVSYWRKKLGFDAAVNYSYGANNGTNNTTINYLQQQSILTQEEKNHTQTNGGAISLSAYYNFDDFNSIDMQFRFGPSKIARLTNSNVMIAGLSGLDNEFANIDRHNSTLSGAASLNYTHKYHKAGNVFYLLSNFTNSTSNGDQLLVSSINNGNIINNTLSVNDIKAPSVTVEAIQQHNSNKKFSYTFGSKLIFRDNENNHSIDENNTLTVTPVIMHQVVSSTYFDADWAIKKFTVHTGLRFDYNHNNYTNPVVVKQSFTNLTPGISLTYNINPINLLLFTFGRRIIRPGFYATAPITNPVNAYETTAGTVNLHNEVDNDWGMQYYGNYKWARIGFNLRYGRGRGAVRDVSTLDSANIIQTVSTNVNTNESYTVGFSADFSFLKKFRFSHYNNYSYAVQRSGTYDNRTWGTYLNDRLSYQANKQNSFDFILSGHTPNINLQGVEQDNAFLNWGINYGHYFDLMKKYPTSIGISVSNPFLYNGLPGYYTVNTAEFSKRRDTKAANSIIGLSMRIQIKGKQLGNRTFNKTKSIQNNDLSVQ